MRSLRQRAIIGGLIWAALSIAIGGVALFYFFDGITQRRFDSLLLDRHLQVVVALSNSDADEDAMNVMLTDAAYQRPYSGRYWQVTGANDAFLASRSLFDATLVAQGRPSIQPGFWTAEGPDERVRGIQQRVSLEDGSSWVVVVAQSLTALEAERQQIRQSLLVTFAFIGVLGIAGAILQTSAVVRPLTKLREDVSHRWDSDETLEPDGYPEEVAPLVSDINTLLNRNREIVDRARRQAADLAHALKTPSAILRNELDALSMKQVDVVQAMQALARVDAQLLRSLARVRASNSAASTHVQTNLSNSVNRMARLFRSMPATSSIDLQCNAAPDLSVPMDVQDLEEILGNLLENAFKWALTKVKISCRVSGSDIHVSIDDDGPGIPEKDRREALRSGGRLDVSSPGTGLGLAIAADLLQSYGGSLNLEQSDDLGGLQVLIIVPARRGLGQDVPNPDAAAAEV